MTQGTWGGKEGRTKAFKVLDYSLESRIVDPDGFFPDPTLKKPPDPDPTFEKKNESGSNLLGRKRIRTRENRILSDF